VRVLVVEDDDVSAAMLENALSEFGYEVIVARDGCEAFELIRNGFCRLIVSDWEMPQMTGVELCRRIRARRSGGYVYVVLLTSRVGPHDAVEGLNAGADDFLTKPFRPQELCVRLRAGERILSLESRDVTIFALAKLAESRDPETGAHLERIREYCRILAETLATRPEFRNSVDGEYVETIYLTSPLHDIGKVGIPDGVLLKPGRLTEEEFEVMKRHTAIGGQTLDAAARAHPEARFLQMACDIAWSHHERYDGTGYPRGLAGDRIPLCGRIVAVADVYDALTTERVYKPAYSHETARSIILEGRGTYFDPHLVDAFVEQETQFLAVSRQLAESDAPPASVPAY
jgi:putative two-component system response regulator